MNRPSTFPIRRGYSNGNSRLLILLGVRELMLIEDSYQDHPAMDVAVSHATLSAVARGDIGAVFRLHVPEPVVAFGRADRVQPGYPLAVRASRAHGFAAVERLAGGRAAVFHGFTLSFSMALPDDDPRRGIRDRFEMISGVMLKAFQSLGIDARIGEVPGEYCPGSWSVNVGGRVKVMGVGQRLVRGGAHIGGVVVVDDGESIRDVLIPVYRALHLDWDPRTSGALADRSPGLDNSKVIKAIVRALSDVYAVVPGQLPAPLLEEARRMIPEHLPLVA
jgi:lipoate-protein ligase A